MVTLYRPLYKVSFHLGSRGAGLLTPSSTGYAPDVDITVCQREIKGSPLFQRVQSSEYRILLYPELVFIPLV